MAPQFHPRIFQFEIRRFIIYFLIKFVLNLEHYSNAIFAVFVFQGWTNHPILQR